MERRVAISQISCCEASALPKDQRVQVYSTSGRDILSRMMGGRR